MKTKTGRQDQLPGNASDSDDVSSPSPKIAVNAADATSATDTNCQAETASPIVVSNPNFPGTLGDEIGLLQGSDGHAYLRRVREPSLPVLRIGTKVADAFLRRWALEHGKYPRAGDLRDVNDYLIAHAEFSGNICNVWYRVAPSSGGIEIDLGDRERTRVHVTAGGVAILDGGSDTLFLQTPTMQALPRPADVGDLGRLKRYLNLTDAERCLATAWISYTLSHPKIPTTSFPILVLHGDQGSGKSFLCRIIQSLIDPSSVHLQTFPRSGRDLSIAAQQAHVLLFDNLREIRPSMSDRLCTAASGGAFVTRRLYSDADQVMLRLHVALVLNGLHPFVDQPDLAQRCLPLTMRYLEDVERRSETTLAREFQNDLPFIFRGILDLIAGVFAHLSEVEVTNPERMLDFSRWLGAMELVDGVPKKGVYQTQYSAALNAGMLDSLLEDPLAAAVMALIDAEPGARWSGTPAELMQTLDRAVNRRTHYARDWPANEIALSKRLKSLHVALRRQGVEVRLHRSRQRLVSITRLEDSSDE